mmetsp:Transcript_8715/g.21135  ORF Transcript_8715/g.21135 Transcript_8715/m.21135 type:complete len:783 (-) Transcript_8715:563-2911(-)
MPLEKFFDKMDEARRLRAPLLLHEKEKVEKILLSKAERHPQSRKPVIRRQALEDLLEEFTAKCNNDKKIFFGMYAEVVQVLRSVEFDGAIDENTRKNAAGGGNVAGIIVGSGGVGPGPPGPRSRERGLDADETEQFVEGLLKGLPNRPPLVDVDLLPHHPTRPDRGENQNSASFPATGGKNSQLDPSSIAEGTTVDNDKLSKPAGLLKRQPTLKLEAKIDNFDKHVDIPHPAKQKTLLAEAADEKKFQLIENLDKGQINGLEMLFHLGLNKIRELNKHADDAQHDLLNVEDYLHSCVVLLPNFYQRNAMVLRLCVIAGYLLLSPLFYCWFDYEDENGDPRGVCSEYVDADGDTSSGYLKSIYFVSVTLSTVGFGDVTPGNNTAKWFTIFYIMFGLGLILGLVMELVAAALEEYSERLERLEKAKEKMEKDRQRRKAQGKDLHTEDGFTVQQDVQLSTEKKPQSAKERARAERERLEHLMVQRVENSIPAIAMKKITYFVLWLLPDRLERWLDVVVFGDHELERQLSTLVYQKMFQTSLMIVLPALFGAIVVGAIEDWNMVDSLYWSIIAVTTVGYGDKSITTVAARMFCVFYLLISTSMVSAALGNLASLQMLKSRKKKQWEFEQRKLSPEMMAEMDTDGNGVDQFEFCLATLVAMEKLSRDDLEPILEKFRELDADGSGVLTKADLLHLGDEVEVVEEADRCPEGIEMNLMNVGMDLGEPYVRPEGEMQPEAGDVLGGDEQAAGAEKVTPHPGKTKRKDKQVSISSNNEEDGGGLVAGDGK